MTRPMTAGRGVTCLAVVGTGMAEGDFGPVGCVVAAGALTRVMSGGCLRCMTALTIVQADVAEADTAPPIGVVAVAARARIMVAWRAVTLGAVVHSLVGYPHLLPGSSKVAAAAVTGVVAGRSLICVAASAVSLTRVVEFYVLPGNILMAAVTLPVIMVGGQLFCVAVLAFLIVGVVEGNICPVSCIVAALTGSFVVRRRCLILVTGCTVGQPCMINVQNRPIFYVVVALSAEAGKMLFGCGSSVA